MLTPILTATAIILGQSTQPTPTTTDTPAADLPAEIMELRRAPLLREGSILDDVPVRVKRADDTRSWIVETLPQSSDEVPHAMIILPNERLEDMQHIITAAEHHQPVFRISGEVFVYHGRNYVLITHAPHLTPEAAPVMEVEDDDDASEIDTPEQPASSESTEANFGGDGVEDISRMLDARVGSVKRGSRSARAPGERTAAPATTSGAPATTSGAPDDAGTGNSTPAASDFTSGVSGGLIVDRRGRVVRGSTGAYTFVFDADAEGGQDAPVILLPCKLLEMLAERTRESSMDEAILLSGRAMQYRGRAMLLPMRYRVAQERTVLVP